MVFRGRGPGNFVPAALAALLASTSLLVVACGGDEEKTQTASGGSPAAASSSLDQVDPEAVKTLESPRGPDSCTNRLSNEEICSDYSNYLLSYRPAAGDPDFKTRGPYLVGSTASTNSEIWIEDVSTGAGNDGKERSRSPSKTDAEGKKTGEYFGRMVEVNFNDDGDIGNSGSVRIKAKAGDVDFGSIHFWLRNEDGADDDDAEGSRYNGDNDWAYCEKQRGGGGGAMYLSCGSMNNPVEGVQSCQDNGDDEECGFSFYLQDYPVRVRVRNLLPDSELEIERVAQAEPSGAENFGFKRSDQASTITGGSKLSGSEDQAESLWLAGFRARAGASVKIVGRLRATTEAAKGSAWNGQSVEMVATWGQVKVKKTKTEDGKSVEYQVTEQPDPTCKVGARSTGDRAGCTTDLTIGKVSTPGTATFTLQK